MLSGGSAAAAAAGAGAGDEAGATGDAERHAGTAKSMTTHSIGRNMPEFYAAPSHNIAGWLERDSCEQRG